MQLLNDYFNTRVKFLEYFGIEEESDTFPFPILDKRGKQWSITKRCSTGAYLHGEMELYSRKSSKLPFDGEYRRKEYTLLELPYGLEGEETLYVIFSNNLEVDRGYATPCSCCGGVKVFDNSVFPNINKCKDCGKKIK